MNKLIIFKWTSLLLSVGCITFFIVNDIYADNEDNYEIPIQIQEEEIQTEDIELGGTENTTEEEVPQVETPVVGCNDAVNAYNAQVASDNDKLSESIEEKYSACMIEPVEAVQEKKVKVAKPSKKEKK